MSTASLEALFSGSPSLRESLRGAERAAASGVNLLILGEPGSGRSSLARALHGSSPRAGEALVELDAGAIPSTLFESELFGYEPGAFTGAERALKGRVAQAEGGTLILDHVEEIPVAVQPKLLRLLAESRYAPLGGTDLEADVRFIAVGPDDLGERVERGTFREDLYYRLEVVTFRLPALRERRQDLRPLVDFFLRDLGERFGRGRPALAPQAWEWMERYDWPGNLREIRNLLERSLILSRREVLSPEPPGRAEERPGSLAEVERRQIRKALAYTRGHQGRAAELLGISRKALWQKRKRYGLP